MNVNFDQLRHITSIGVSLNWWAFRPLGNPFCNDCVTLYVDK